MLEINSSAQRQVQKDPLMSTLGQFPPARPTDPMLPSVGAENPVERGQDDIAATRKRVDVPAERVQGNSTHGRRVEEMISAIDLEHWQQIGRFAWEPEIR